MRHDDAIPPDCSSIFLAVIQVRLNAINDLTQVACDYHALMRSGANINGIVLLKHKRDSLGVNPFVCIDLNEHLRPPFAV
jgi:hypothetical protein